MKKELCTLIHLSMGFAGAERSMDVDFDREVWNNIVNKCAERGYTGILLDVSNGIKFKSHPEIADKYGWTVEEALTIPNGQRRKKVKE